MRLLSVLFAVLSALISVPASAQENAETALKRCAAYSDENTWTYAGTILATGYGGLHGINAAWETPHIVVGGGYNDEGRLSPDGRWYLTLKENVIYSESLNHLHEIEAIHVHSTFDDNTAYIVPWQNSWVNMWGRREVFWFDNEHILYEFAEDPFQPGNFFLINPFTSEITPQVFPVDILDGGSGFDREYIQTSSPDFTRTIYQAHVYDLTSEVPLPPEDALAKLEAPKWKENFLWLPDSSAFIGEIAVTEDHTRLDLFDRDGSFMTTLFDLGEERIFPRYAIQVSPDGRYLVFEHGTLHLIDIKTGTVTDTCLNPGRGFAYSPDGTQIAFVKPGRGLQEVYVFDLPTWTYRAVAYHIVKYDISNRVIGWRKD